MASSYNSLGIQLMATGENAGTWGTLTNENLNFFRDVFGWITIAMTADRTLTIPDASTGTYDGRAFIIKLTGSTGGNRVLDIAATAGSGSSPGGTASILKPFLIIDGTTRGASDTITFKVTGATGIAIPKYGTVNVHASLLPKWRGAAPMQRSIMNFDRETGITIMKIVEELDAGPIIHQDKIKISENVDTKSLSKLMSQ